MRRVNTFRVVPRTDADEECLRRLLDASASLWNEVNYSRRQHLTDPEIDAPIWDADTHYDRYKGVLGSATAQQVKRKNDQAWRSFFKLKESGEANGLPGYWGNESDGRDLRTYIRNNQYTLRWATGANEQSILDIPVGSDLKDEHDIGYHERLRLDVRGDPKWSGDPGQLELYYDDVSDTFRAIQPVKNCSRRDSLLADHTAALDVGANNIVACTTSTGEQYLYEGRDLFDRFRETTMQIAEYQSMVKRDEGKWSSERIRRLYRKRTNRRNHAMDALARDLIERLHREGVSTVLVGDLTGILDTHWSVEANAKTHNFWAFRRFIDRLACTAEEFGMSVEAKPETDTTRECPKCGEKEATGRHGDYFRCPCGYEGHADLDASQKFLKGETNSDVVGPMARPVRLKWDDHRWSELSRSPLPNEVRTNQQNTSVGSSA